MKHFKFSTLLIIFILISGCEVDSSNPRQENKTMPDYFEPLSQEAIPEALNMVNLASCEEFIEIYIKNSQGTVNEAFTGFSASAYDTAMCVPQDLHKAFNLYNELYDKDYSSLGPLLVRLALLYEFGPEDLRNKEKANFFYKQAVIVLARAQNPEIRDQIIYAAVGDKEIVPDALKKELVWIEEVMKKNKVQRTELAKKLKEEGFKDTANIEEGIIKLD